jgi:hypothetical protein
MTPPQIGQRYQRHDGHRVTITGLHDQLVTLEGDNGSLHLTLHRDQLVNGDPILGHWTPQ